MITVSAVTNCAKEAIYGRRRCTLSFGPAASINSNPEKSRCYTGSRARLPEIGEQTKP